MGGGLESGQLFPQPVGVCPAGQKTSNLKLPPPHTHHLPLPALPSTGAMLGWVGEQQEEEQRNHSQEVTHQEGKRDWTGGGAGEGQAP